MKLKPALVAAAIASVIASATFAQTAPPPAAAPAPEPTSPFSVNVGVASSYIYRGLNQSDYKPALQIGADYVSPSGFYVGVWGSSIRWVKDFGIGTANTEFDVYGGYKGEAAGIGYDVGVLQYIYNGSVSSGAVRDNTTEIYVAGTFQMFTLKYSHVVSNAIFGVANAKNSGYFDLSGTFPIMDNLALNAHVGHQIIKNTGGLGTYTDGKLELAYDFGNGLGLSGGVTATDADKGFYTPVSTKFTGKTTPYLLLKYSKSF
ncbi:MAG: TorF family putative porin [Casimicrobium sp.]